MSWISVDVESDGPIPGFGIPPMAKTLWGYSMIAIGACLVKDPKVGYLGYLKPISEQWVPEALAVSGFTRMETEQFPDPRTTMAAFNAWIHDVAEPPYIFAADNNGFDFAWVNWYFHQFGTDEDSYHDRSRGNGRNPFGFSSKNVNNLYQGLMNDTFKSFKHLRKTKHDHNPLHDAQGNAEALLYMKEHMGLKVKF